jgi:Uma2 family endonuclease
MTTMLKLGPADHGRRLTFEEYMGGDYAEGYQYELIDGKLYVSPLPNSPQDYVLRWLEKLLSRYSEKHPEVINHITTAARVFVPGRTDVTVPEPDLTAYQDYPHDLPIAEMRWEDFKPLLVVEILSLDDPDKDLVRNVDLYLQVPSIKEYWVLDTREDVEHPSLIAHRRYRKRWIIDRFASDETYTTKLLPGFRLKLNVRS